MGIAISDDHLELSNVAETFLATPARSPRPARCSTPPRRRSRRRGRRWPTSAGLGLHLPEAHGGSGFGLAELVLVVEAMGAVVAPGPFLPTVWASAVHRRAAAPTRSRPSSCPVWPTVRSAPAVGLDDRTNLVLGAGLADLFLLPAGDDLVVATRDDVTVTVPTNTDATAPGRLRHPERRGRARPRAHRRARHRGRARSRARRRRGHRRRARRA